MEKYYILSNGVKIPSIGFGTWRVPESEQCVEACITAINAGYRHIDTASFYKNEKSVGEAVALSSVPRNELFITSKLWNDVGDFDGALKAFEQSLNELKTDYLDLCLIHWPNPKAYREGHAKRNAEVWRALEYLYRLGKVKAIGVSNFMPHHIDELLKTAEICPMVNQIEIQPGLNREEIVKYNTEHGILTEAWAPFRIGEALSDSTICALAEKYNKTPAQITLRWFLQKGILPLPKSVTKSRIESNIEVYDFTLSDKDVKLIDGITPHEARHNPDTIDF